MPDPSTLRDMDKGAARLADAIVRRERIAVFGDYDVDGACSSALMQRFLAAHGLRGAHLHPRPHDRGLRPQPRGHRGAGQGRRQADRHGRLRHHQRRAAGGGRPLGADVVVVDHHQADERLPDVAAVINPNRQDDLSGLGHLCAAGVTFMVLVATSRELRRRGTTAPSGRRPICWRCSTSSALATVCDVVPLQGPQPRLRDEGPAGHAPAPQHRAARRWPMPPASPWRRRPITWASCWGRASTPAGASATPALGARLLATDDEMEAARIAVLLDKLNRERKAHRGADAGGGGRPGRAAGGGRPRPAAAAARRARAGTRAWWAWSRAGWSSASSRPACVIAWDEARTRAPARCARSTASISARRCGRRWRPAISPKGGGHAMAAGLTVARAQLEALRGLPARAPGGEHRGGARGACRSTSTGR